MSRSCVADNHGWTQRQRTTCLNEREWESHIALCVWLDPTAAHSSKFTVMKICERFSFSFLPHETVRLHESESATVCVKRREGKKIKIQILHAQRLAHLAWCPYNRPICDCRELLFSSLLLSEYFVPTERWSVTQCLSHEPKRRRK